MRMQPTEFHKKNSAIKRSFYCGIRRRPTLPDRYQSSTIGTEGKEFDDRRWREFHRMLSQQKRSDLPCGESRLLRLRNLTSVFGMGTGGTPSSLPPEMVSYVIEIALHSTRGFPYLRFRKFRPSSLPFLPPSGLKVFSHPDNCTVSIQCKRLFSINLRITLL